MALRRHGGWSVVRDSAVGSFAAMRRNAESVEMTTKQGDCSLPAKKKKKNETEISVHLQAVPLCLLTSKVHCHAIQCFYVDFFCGRKWRRGDSRSWRQSRRSRPLPHFFFLHLFRASQSIDVGVSVSYPCKVIPSPLSDKVGLGRYRSRK